MNPIRDVEMEKNYMRVGLQKMEHVIFLPGMFGPSEGELVSVSKQKHIHFSSEISRSQDSERLEIIEYSI